MITNMYLHQKGFGRVYTIATFLFFINSMHPWFFLEIPDVFISLVYFVITLIATSKGFFIFSSRKTMIFCFSMMFIWMKIFGSVFGIAEAILNSFIYASILSLRKDLLMEIMHVITKWLAILLLVSIFAYILFKIGVPFPHFPINRVNFAGDRLECYIFFLYNHNFFNVARFQSIFLEPGYLTLGVAPILFLYKYDIKNRYVLILMIAQLLSFSLAGYVLMLFGYIFCNLCDNGKEKFRRMLISFIFLFFCILVLIQVLGSNYFQTAIIDRIQWEDGKLVGDDRSSLYLDWVYEEMMKTNKMWIGTDYNPEMSDKGVSGYKLFAVHYGLIGVILVVVAYLSSVGLRNIRVNHQTGLVALCLLMLYQNSYPTAMCILIPIASVTCFLKKNKSQTFSSFKK